MKTGIYSHFMYLLLLVRSILMVFGQELPLILQIYMFILININRCLSSCSQPTLIPKIIFKELKNFYLILFLEILFGYLLQSLLHVYSGYPKISALVHSSHNHCVCRKYLWHTHVCRSYLWQTQYSTRHKV